MGGWDVGQLASIVNGETVGDFQRVIRDIGSLETATNEQVTFVLDEKRVRELRDSRAGACLVARKHHASIPGSVHPTLILVDDAHDAFVKLIQNFRPPQPAPNHGESTAAFVAPTAQIGLDCQIYPGVYIDDRAVIGHRCVLYPGVYVGRESVIGNDSTLYPYVVLYPGVSVGERALIHAHAVVGADGFGYRFRNGRYEKIPQVGTVTIGDDCEIGACATIDRATIGATTIGSGTKIDNLVMIGHNCRIGKHNAFASQAGLAGSVSTGDYVRLAGQVGIADHLHLGTGCTIGAKSGVHRNVPEGDTQIGSPSRTETEEMKILMSLSRVPQMRKSVLELEREVTELKTQMASLLAHLDRSKAA